MSGICLNQIQYMIFLFAILLVRAATLAATDPHRERIFEEALQRSSLSGDCFPYDHLIADYLEKLHEANIQPKTEDRLGFKRETDTYLQKHKVYRVWANEFDAWHSICMKENPNNNLYEPSTAPPASYSVKQTFETYPYLKSHLHPSTITQMINFLPSSLTDVLHLVRYTFVDGALYTSPALADAQWTKYLRGLPPQPDMDFVVLGRDELHEILIANSLASQPSLNNSFYNMRYETLKRILIELPIFMPSKDTASPLEFNKLLFLDTYIAYNRWSDAIRQVEVESRRIPWTSKVERAFWRGAPAGKIYEQVEGIWDNLQVYYPRMYAVVHSNKHPQYLDMQMVSSLEQDLKPIKENNLNVSIVKSQSYAEHLKFKYLISIDGWSACWLRVPWIMASNSLLLKQDSTKVQWFYDELKPGVHFVEVNANLSNLIEKVIWLKENDDIAPEIIKNANEFVRRRLMPDQLRRQAIRMLAEYASFQNLEVTLSERILVRLGHSYHDLHDLKLAWIASLITGCIGAVLLWIIYNQVFGKRKAHSGLEEAPGL